MFYSLSLFPINKEIFLGEVNLYDFMTSLSKIKSNWAAAKGRCLGLLSEILIW